MVDERGGVAGLRRLWLRFWVRGKIRGGHLGSGCGGGVSFRGENGINGDRSVCKERWP